MSDLMMTGHGGHIFVTRRETAVKIGSLIAQQAGKMKIGSAT